MKLYLIRTRTRQRTTDGVLKTSAGIRICDTAELTAKRLPAGHYRLCLKRHPKQNRRMPYLTANEGIWMANGYLMQGNGVYGRNFGSNILVGDYLVPGVVIHSKAAFDRLQDRLEKVIRRGGDVEIEII